MSDHEAQIQEEAFDEPIAVGGQEHHGINSHFPSVSYPPISIDNHDDFFGSGEPQNQHDDFSQPQHQEYNQDFGGHDQGYQQPQGGAAEYDDFFGGSQPQGSFFIEKKVLMELLYRRKQPTIRCSCSTSLWWQPRIWCL